MNHQHLKEIFLSHEGKVVDKWELYLEIYQDEFERIRENKVTILEIGVQNGGSLEIWSKFFPNHKEIVGCDIDKNCEQLKYSDPLISVIVGDANNSETISQIYEISQTYDLIVDDGSHVSDDVIKGFINHFPNLSPGGSYVIEDLHTAYWPQWGGGLNNSHGSMNFIFTLIHLVNRNHWRGDGNELSAWQYIAPGQYRDVPEEFLDSLAYVESIKIFDSVCIIKKALERKQNLGKRIVRGGEKPVTVSNFHLDGTSSDEGFAFVKSMKLNFEFGTSDSEIIQLRKELSEIRNSRIWKVTRIYRKLRDKIQF